MMPNWANATHVCTCEVDVDTGDGQAAALHRGRGLRPDDQPRRRGGADRRRHGAGHRRRAARGAGVRRARQPARHHLPGLPRAHRVRRADHRVRPHGDDGRRPGRIQGRGRGRCHRRAACSGQRGERLRSRRSAWRSCACPCVPTRSCGGSPKPPRTEHHGTSRRYRGNDGGARRQGRGDHGRGIGHGPGLRRGLRA